VEDKDPFQGKFDRPAFRRDKLMAVLSLVSYVIARGLLVFTLLDPSTLPNHLAKITNFTVDGSLTPGPAVVDCACGLPTDLWYRQGDCAKQLAKALEPFYYPFLIDLGLLILGWKLGKYFPLSLHNSLAPLCYGLVYNRIRTPVALREDKPIPPSDIIVSVPDQTQPSPRNAAPRAAEPTEANEFKWWEKLILGWIWTVPFAGFAVPYRDFMTNVDVWAPCNGVIYGTKDVVMALMATQAAIGGICLNIAFWCDIWGVLCCWCLCKKCCKRSRLHNLYRIGWEKI